MGTYLPVKKIVLVSNLEDTFIDRSQRTAYCALRAYRAIYKEKRLGECLVDSDIDMYKYHKENYRDRDFVRAFIGLCRIIRDKKEYVPLLMTIQFSGGIISEYLKDPDNQEILSFFERKLQEVKQKYKAIMPSSGNYFAYEDAIFNQSEWLKYSLPYPNTANQLRYLATLLSADAVNHTQRNAFSLYFLSTGSGQALRREAWMGTILSCKDFNSGTDTPSEILRLLKIIAEKENVHPKQVWLLSEGFIDSTGLLKNAGFENRILITSETINPFIENAVKAGMLLAERNNLANKLLLIALHKGF